MSEWRHRPVETTDGPEANRWQPILNDFGPEDLRPRSPQEALLLTEQASSEVADARAAVEAAFKDAEQAFKDVEGDTNAN